VVFAIRPEHIPTNSQVKGKIPGKLIVVLEKCGVAPEPGSDFDDVIGRDGGVVDGAE